MSQSHRRVGFSITDDSGHESVHDSTLNLLGRLVEKNYSALHLDPSVELEVTLISSEQMEQLHIEWMDLPGATDVMSFPMDELRPGTEADPVTDGVLGDIVICPDVAEQQAQDAGHSLEDELALLATHGMLHLVGYDHGSDSEREVMFELQRTLLETFLGRSAPVPTVE